MAADVYTCLTLLTHTHTHTRVYEETHTEETTRKKHMFMKKHTQKKHMFMKKQTWKKHTQQKHTEETHMDVDTEPLWTHTHGNTHAHTPTKEEAL